MATRHPYPPTSTILHSSRIRIVNSGKTPDILVDDQGRPIIVMLSNKRRTQLEPYLPSNRIAFLNDKDPAATQSSARPPVTLDPDNPMRTTYHPRTTIPHVTLTYAQSLDGQIALHPGVRTAISGPATKTMTQYLRSRHDAILIGRGTAMADNPGLNTLYSDDGQYPVGLDRQPRPIILDPSNQWREDACEKLFDLAEKRQGRPPWTVNSVDQTGDEERETVTQRVNQDRSRLRSVGGGVIQAGEYSSKENGVDWEAILSALGATGVRSVMIEGGAAVINDLLRQRNQHWIDSIIVTIAPTYFGEGDVHVAPFRNQTNQKEFELSDVKWLDYGNDIVMAWTKPRSVSYTMPSQPFTIGQTLNGENNRDVASGPSGSRSGQPSTMGQTSNGQNNGQNNRDVTSGPDGSRYGQETSNRQKILIDYSGPGQSLITEALNEQSDLDGANDGTRVSNYTASGLNTPISSIEDSSDAIKSRMEVFSSLEALQNFMKRYIMEAGPGEYQQNSAPALKAFVEAESKLAAAIIPKALKTLMCEKIRNSKQDLFLIERSNLAMSPTSLFEYEKAIMTAVDETYELMKSHIETHDGIGQQND
ncbi:2,5-diamino-6-ribosylamino-4(3H)-pyrimidinone 5'-phosphate reductase [Lachnellula arida]|uniref:2,5-diamino-6-ribosylamino-4(3H)-pyrimidinone 5'-phosphate reductase n=1 Tax=Lachnellula arida TaxID=1316785 RepID=A0A8T9B2G5_9HELO|nr:2,5-diamino-6-ribosylamino-4(3H)-pyrimidinone 5'-phosphate reductase [Lachnellula arida]